MYYLSLLVCAVISMILGAIWYGPLFGKKWAQIIGATNHDLEARKEMQKKAIPLYVLQFVITLFQVYMLSFFVSGTGYWFVGVINSLILCVAFVLPTVASGAMWNNDSKKVSWARFLIQAGYQLIVFALFGIVLTLLG